MFAITVAFALSCRFQMSFSKALAVRDYISLLWKKTGSLYVSKTVEENGSIKNNKRKFIYQSITNLSSLFINLLLFYLI